MQLTEHFSLEEMTRSDAAVRKNIDNTPPPAELNNLKLLCHNVLEPLRLKVNEVIRITSGYRCEKLNKLIGGAKNSQHVEGKAADIRCENMSTEELFIFITNSNLPYCQCINEFQQWIHVSYDPNNIKREKLRATKVNGKTVYTKA